MTNEAWVLWRTEDGVGHITLNRPGAANAIHAPLAQQFAVAVEAAARSDVGAVLLSATGAQYCAGGDLHEFMARRANFDTLIREMLDILHPAIYRLATLPVPVLSAVHAPVGGMEKGIPLGRGGTPGEAAGAVFLLYQPESDYVSGQTLMCTRGLTGI